MGKALLINPSYSRTYGSNAGALAFPVFPVLGLASVAGGVRDAGHDVRILDLSYRPYNADYLRDVIRQERPDVVGVTATTPLANQMRDISFLVKDLSPSIITVAGGAHPTALPAETLGESALDYVSAGEGDWVVAQLLSGRNPADIPGLYRREHGHFESVPAAPLLGDLDELPMPCWEHYPMEGNNRVTRLTARHLPLTTIEFSRGCIYSCDFCGSKNTMGRGYRKKSPERCVEEIERVARLGFREVLVVDDIFTTDNDWAASVCEAIIRSGVKMAWTCSNGIRVDSANLELFELMKRAGCYRVYFGFESGNQDVLRAFGKGGRASLEKGIEAVDLARAAGLEPNGFFMVGLSGDDEASMQDTINYAKTVRLDGMKCGICVPFPGTPMFRQLHNDGRIKTVDWDMYTVYNNAETIYDHPTLDWETITRYFRKFYIDALAKNPAYLWRRLRFALRNHEFFWNVYYTIKFSGLLWGRTKDTEQEEYAYADKWRPLDLGKTSTLGEYTVPIVRRTGTKRPVALLDPPPSNN